MAITDKEFRAFFGDRRLISPTDLTKLIQDGRAYEETLEPKGGHVVVIYIRTDEGDVHTLLVEGESYFERLRYFLPPRQAAQVYFFTLDVDPNNVEKAKATLAGPDKYRTALRLTDAILRVEKDPTRIIDLIREFVEANVPGEGKELANAILDFIALIPPENAALILEFLQLMLDIVGLFPGLGEPLDALNAAISLGREKYLDAGLSAASMIPVVGAIPGAGKALRRIAAIVRFADALPAGIRGVLLDLLTGLKDELASLDSRKMSDIVSGLKRRINEAADRLRLAAKKKDDAPLPGGAGNKKASSNSPKDDAIPAAPPPGKPDPDDKLPPKDRKEQKPPSKTSKTPDADTSDADISANKLNQMLREKVGPPPKDMPDPHSHHVLPKKGLGKKQQALVEEGKAILREVKIDSVQDLENIVWAPMRVKGQHGIDSVRHVVDKLKEYKATGRERDDFVKLLEELGALAAKRGEK